MMNPWTKIFRLSSTLCQINFSFMNVRHKWKEYHNSYVAVLACFIVGMVVFLYSYYYQMIEHFYIALVEINMDGLFYRLVMVGMVAILSVVSAFLLVDMFCFSKDMEQLLVFPVLPCYILTSKYLIVALFCCVLEALLLFPVSLVQFRYTGDLSVFATGISVVYLLSVFTVFPAAVVVTVCLKMAIVLKQSRTLWLVGGLLLWLIGHIVFRMAFAQRQLQMGEQAIDWLLAATTPFPLYDVYISWNIALKVGCVIFFVAVLIVYYYLSRVIIGDRYMVYSKERQYRGRKVKYRSSARLPSYFRKECKNFFRNPLYVFNGLFGILITPFLLPLFFKMGATAESTAQIRQLVTSTEFSQYATVLALVVIVLTSSINVVAASSFSREGANYWIVQIIPYALKQQAYVKILFSMAVSVTGILLNCVIFKWYFHYGYAQIVVIALVGTWFAVLWNFIGVFIDMKHPKLTWLNEAEAVKQNINVVVSIIICIAISLSYLFCVTKMMQAALPSYLIVGSVMGSLSMLIALVNVGIIRQKENIYSTSFYPTGRNDL